MNNINSPKVKVKRKTTEKKIVFAKDATIRSTFFNTLSALKQKKTISFNMIRFLI